MIKKYIGWDEAISAILILGLLPSFSALSGGIAQALPSLAPYLGPLNPLKFFFPLFLLYLWRRKSDVSGATCTFLISFFTLGTLATLISAYPCNFPSSHLREWAVMCIGLLAGTAFTLLPHSHATIVAGSWVALVFGSALLDRLWPSALDWTLIHVFDPYTRYWDFVELGKRTMAGLFGRQSLAKLIALTPWILLSAAAGEKKLTQKKLALFALLITGSLGIVLLTTQRGPFIAILGTTFAFALHQSLLRKKKVVLLGAGVAVLLGLSVALAILPKDIIETRLKSLVGLGVSHSESAASANATFRLQMALFTLETINKSPDGSACIPAPEYYRRGLTDAHSHSLLLEQFKSRGWLFGAFHALAWIMALLIAWKSPNDRGSALFAGICSLLILGLFDHPWFVLNQALILGTLLMSALKLNTLSKNL